MKKVKYTKFGKTKLVPHITYTDGQVDLIPEDVWDDELWVERGEDWYALSYYQRNNKTVLVVTRDDFINAEETIDSKNAKYKEEYEKYKLLSDKEFDVEQAKAEWKATRHFYEKERDKYLKLMK